MFISILSTLTTSAQIKRPQQLSNNTYEVHINTIRIANEIFLEHKTYVEATEKIKADVERYINMIAVLESYNKELQSDKADLLSIIEVKDAKITNNDTYYQERLRVVKKQRNKAYLVTLASVVFVLVVTSK